MAEPPTDRNENGAAGGARDPDAPPGMPRWVKVFGVVVVLLVLVLLAMLLFGPGEHGPRRHAPPVQHGST